MDTRTIGIIAATVAFLAVGAYWIVTPQGFCSGSIWDCFVRKQPISLAGIQLFGAYVTVVLVLIVLGIFWLVKTLTKP